MKKIVFIVFALFAFSVRADNVITSKSYVDTAANNLQNQIGANNANTVLTYTGSAYTNAVAGTLIYEADYEVSINYMNNRKRYVNSLESLPITTTLDNNSSDMYLFAGNYVAGGGANWLFKGRVYYLQITNGDTISHNFIPERRDSDGELGMYDLVSDTFLTNAGTGEFVARPVFSYLPQAN